MFTTGLIADLSIVLVAAAICGWVAHKLRQPLVLGYIAAGLLAGPYLVPPGLISERTSIETLGLLGVGFLLFSLGLDFNLSKLRSLGASALIVGCLEIPLLLVAGHHLGGLLGWSPTEQIFLGAVISISSTTIIVKILTEMGRERSTSARLIYAVLVVEDIVAVIILAALSALATTGSAQVGDLLATGAGVVAFVLATAIVGSLVAPKLIRRVAASGSSELLLSVAVGALFLVVLAALQFGYSLALGAFLAGAVIGESKGVHVVQQLVAPLRDLFGAVFFVSVGLHIDPWDLVALWPHILAFSALVILGKMAACSFGSFVAGWEPKVALATGIGLAQIGEFSFIIAQLGVSLGVVGDRLYALTVGVSALTALASPWLIRSSDRLVARFERHAPAPLVTYIELYASWVSRLKLPGSTKLLFSLLKKPILQTLLNLVVIAGVLAGARALAPAMDPGAGEVVGMRVALLWTAAVVIAMPFIIAAWRKVRAISLMLAEAALSGRAMPQPRALAMRNLLANTGSLVAGVGLVAWLLLACAPFLPPLPILGASAVFITLLTVLLYRWMVHVHASLQAGILRFAESSSDGRSETTLPNILKDHPFGGTAVEITLPGGSPAAGRSLKDLDLRSRTGATAIPLARPGSPPPNPAETRLAGGDRLILLGDEEQIARAREILCGPRSVRS